MIIDNKVLIISCLDSLRSNLKGINLLYKIKDKPPFQ